jgi:hypothetical protein
MAEYCFFGPLAFQRVTLVVLSLSQFVVEEGVASEDLFLFSLLKLFNFFKFFCSLLLFPLFLDFHILFHKLNVLIRF